MYHDYTLGQRTGRVQCLHPHLVRLGTFKFFSEEIEYTVEITKLIFIANFPNPNFGTHHYDKREFDISDGLNVY